MNSDSLSSFLAAFKKFRYGMVLRPSRDWSVLLLVVGICLLGSVIWNVWTFGRIASGEILGSGVDQSKTIDTSAFDRVKKQFERRASESNQYRFDYHFIDPSRQ